MASRAIFLVVAAAAAALLSDAKRQCCFTNPQYAGVCVVEPAEGETCATILDYLNNVNSQGKNYCGNTSIRRGWKRAECEKKSDGAGAASVSPAVDRSVLLARDR